MQCDRCLDYYAWPRHRLKLDLFRQEEATEPDICVSLAPGFVNAGIIQAARAVLCHEEKGSLTKTRTYRQDDGTFLFIREDLQGRFLLAYDVDPSWRDIRLLSDCSHSRGKLAFETLGRIFYTSVLTLEGVVIHSVAMEYQGHGILLAAPSGIGKTTHSQFWRDAMYAEIINGDGRPLQN